MTPSTFISLIEEKDAVSPASSEEEAQLARLGLAVNERIIYIKRYPRGHINWVLTNLGTVHFHPSWPRSSAEHPCHASEHPAIARVAGQLGIHIDPAMPIIIKRWRRMASAFVPHADVIAAGPVLKQLMLPTTGLWYRTQDDIDTEKVVYLTQHSWHDTIKVARMGRGYAILDGHHRYLAAWFMNEPVLCDLVPIGDV